MRAGFGSNPWKEASEEEGGSLGGSRLAEGRLRMERSGVGSLSLEPVEVEVSVDAGSSSYPGERSFPCCRACW